MKACSACGISRSEAVTWRHIIAFGLALFCMTAVGETNDAKQLVLVITNDWNATQGTLSAFESTQGQWQQHGPSTAISIGKSGSAWGLGLHDKQTGPQKREGDGRSPAGMFAIGTAFGYPASAATGLVYQPMTEFDYCIDVDDSPLYNQIVDARKVGREAVARSTEPMRRDIHVKGDPRYALGFVIEHNSQAARSAGSCIFAHLWQSPGQTTAGCTAMSVASMKQLLGWLERNQRPVFVLLPRAEYERLKAPWRLPEVPVEQ
jgi:L,D-peptidoglycan transpeptidase YkuD (ErfK/YbiS/YcfS/YnhG family)